MNQGINSEVRFCPKCGTAAGPHRFCARCGDEFVRMQVPAQAAPVAVQTNAPQIPRLAAQQQPVYAEKKRPSNEYIRNLIVQSEDQKSVGGKKILGGVVMIIIWMICFFTPAIYINLIFFIIIGPIMICHGAYIIHTAEEAIAGFRRQLQY